ncbi:hypothetical protein [Cellulomonas sp. URHE0023]|uniref:hypothetical protein n=1 Tax=Cellulomonas sp. URHE0023 TaxID=1380354 RepID=UPI0012DEB9DE|nr:hypothetical protein [Cellulomonas sp. URHE0023]
MSNPLVPSASDVVLVSSVVALVLGGGAMLLRSLFRRPERVPVRVRSDDDER